MAEAQSRRHVLSTAGVSMPRQFAYWREAVCETFLRLHVERDPQDGFKGEIKSFCLGDVRLHRVDAQPLRVSLMADDLPHRDRDCLYINVQTSGESHVRQNGHERRVRQGEWYVLDGLVPFDLRYDQDFVTVNFEVPRQIFRERVGDESSVVGRVFGASGGVERILRDVAQSLSEQADDVASDEAERTSTMFVDVLGLALNKTDRVRDASSRRMKIERYVRVNLEDPDLSAVSIARACNISLRTLHATFAASGDTVMHYVRACRLRAAAHLLLSQSRHLSITDIAHASGFKDSATFSRSFRDHFGMAPRFYRSDNW